MRQSQEKTPNISAPLQPVHLSSAQNIFHFRLQSALLRESSVRLRSKVGRTQSVQMQMLRRIVLWQCAIWLVEQLQAQSSDLAMQQSPREIVCTQFRAHRPAHQIWPVLRQFSSTLHRQMRRDLAVHLTSCAQTTMLFPKGSKCHHGNDFEPIQKCCCQSTMCEERSPK